MQQLFIFFFLHFQKCSVSIQPDAFLLLQQVAGFPVNRCLEGGLWTSTGRWTKDEATETEDIRMMETS